MTLYEVLGVPRDATPAVVKKAYRKLAKRLHPDANPGDPGDPDAPARYREACEAYEVLSDPDRRARYDATGDTARPKTDDSELLGILVPLLMQSIQEAVNNPWESNAVARRNLADDVRAKVKSQLKNVEQAMKNFEQGRDALKTALGRFTVSEGANLLEEVLQNQLRQLESELLVVRADADRFTRALNYLKKVKYRTDAAAGGGQNYAEAVANASRFVLGWATEKKVGE